jgi:phenylalanyl-tRNA synthetase alpha chain
LDDLKTLSGEAEAAVDAAGDLQTLDEIRVRYLGKKGELTALLKSLGTLPAEERPQAGQAINEAKERVQSRIEARRRELEDAALARRLAGETIVVTLPGRVQHRGWLHPVTSTLHRI